MTTIKTRKKLIEVALPLEAINVASAKEKSIRHGHPSTLHLYWARRPLATARAVIFAQMVDDPSANPELFSTAKAQDKERKRLFKIIEDLVKWENTTNETVLQAARDEIWMSWRRTCADNADHPKAKELFDRNRLPGFHDPFAGGGALPLEAQRLGLESFASDLNPLSVLINKAMIEIPSRFANKQPATPEVRFNQELINRKWEGASGLAEDLRYYGKLLREKAQASIGHLYPKIAIDEAIARDRPDLQKYIGQSLTVVAWVWARTVKSPNPAFANAHVPLASTFLLSVKEGKGAYVVPKVTNDKYEFKIKVGSPPDEEQVKRGTKLARGANFGCILSGVPISGDYIKAEGMAGRMGSRLMAIVVDCGRERAYLNPTVEHEQLSLAAIPSWRPELMLTGSNQYLGVRPYGMTHFHQLFTNRQLVALDTLTDQIPSVLAVCEEDAKAAGFSEVEAAEYAKSLGVYLGLGVSKIADSGNSLVSWKASMDQPIHLFTRQAIPMMWDYAEPNIFSGAMGDPIVTYKTISRVIENLPASKNSKAIQQDAQTQEVSLNKVVSTDPPYYDNVPYADLSDFFYVWLRKSLQGVYPDLMGTLAVPKDEELVAFAYRHADGKAGAESFFLRGMTQAMQRIASQAHPSFPVTIYYAFKQSETDDALGTASTGWETFLEAVIKAGFETSGTWPMRTELANRIRGIGANALASSIVLVCRVRPVATTTTTKREFVALLQNELPMALSHLQAGNIAPVDLAQAAIGPGMAIFTRFSSVIEADGSTLSVRNALILINQVLDEQMEGQEANWDEDTRWAVVWFDQYAFGNGDFGQADQLARAKNTAVHGVVEAGVAVSSAGSVRLYKPEELPADWAPETDKRLTVWEMLHHLIRLLKHGEMPAAAMLARLGDQAEAAKELAYRLYGICEKKKRSTEGQLYNDLISVWPDLVNQSKQASAPTARPGELELDA